MKKRGIIAGLAILVLIGGTRAVFAADPCAETVMTASGSVRGMSESGTATCVWRGLPYAAPPVDGLRWKAPQPVKPWSEARDASKWGDRCMQAGGLLGGGGAPGTGMSEDCLSLNVWRPRGPGLFPVMVWVHGGGYYVGSGSDPQYWGDRLAEAGQVIVVTINYRLDLMGFMASPALREEDPHHSTGSYGTLDQVAALTWVHDNIKNFGGDPDRVTIFGQSAGGASICTLVATPLAAGLFQRAIMQSGLCELSQNLEPAYAQTKSAAKILGCDPNDLACLRKLPAQKIIDKAAGSLLKGFIYMPCHDGHVLTATPLAMIESGHYNRVSFLAGTVADEFGKALKLKGKNRRTPPAKYEARLMDSFGMSAEQARQLAALYPLKDYEGRPVEAMGRMFGADAVMQCPTHRGLIALVSDANPAWFFRFEYHGMKFGKYLGAYHTAELPFLFNAFDRPPAKTFYKGMDLAGEKELSRVMQAYWTNFAKTGDPNGPGLPEWKPFATEDQSIQILDVGKVQNQPAELEGRCGFWAEYTKDFVPLANRLIGSLF